MTNRYLVCGLDTEDQKVWEEEDYRGKMKKKENIYGSSKILVSIDKVVKSKETQPLGIQKKKRDVSSSNGVWGTSTLSDKT